MRDLFLPDKIERVLIACESSGVSRNAWNQAGFDCWSVDLLEADDQGEKHIVGCALEVIDDGWDLIIAHPPCTYLCNSGVWMLSDKHLHKDPDRWEKLDEACRFFRAFIDAPAVQELPLSEYWTFTSVTILPVLLARPCKRRISRICFVLPDPKF